MLKIVWTIIAIYNIDGFEIKKYLDETKHAYKTVGECVTEALLLPTEIKGKTVSYQCAQLYNGQRYSSQPSWMTNEQAEAMVEKQNLNK